MPAAILYVRKLLQIIVLPCLLTNSGFTSNIATGADVMRDLFTIISEIHKFDKSPVIVAVDGRSAAGKTTLSGELKKELGCSVNEYILNEKIEQAKLLLAGTTDSIQSISDNLAFSNRSYFYTCFQKKTGMSPTEYRKHHE